MVFRLALVSIVFAIVGVGCGATGGDQAPMNPPPSASGQNPKEERGYSDEERESFNKLPK